MGISSSYGKSLWSENEIIPTLITVEKDTHMDFHPGKQTTWPLSVHPYAVGPDN